MAALWAALRPYVNQAIGCSMVGLAVSDRYFFLAPLGGYAPGGCALVERSGLARYDFSRGEVVVFMSPMDHGSSVVTRLIGLPGDWISVPETEEIRKIPEGHCWVEGDSGSDSRYYGPVPLGLVQGRVTHVVWPPHKIGRVDKRMPGGRVMPQRHF